MRISQIIVFLVLTFAANIYAEEEQITIVEPKIADATIADDSARISQCETEIRLLTGRIEVLEHTVNELQKNHDVSHISPVSDTPMAVASVDSKIQASTADDAAEKRDYDTALAALKDSKFVEAEAMFSSFIQKYPSSGLISNAYFWHAESFYRRGEFDKAAVHYLKGYKQFPKAAKAADYLFKLALSLGEIKKTKEACAILAKLEEEFKQRPASSIKRAYDAKMKFGCK
jgi:tol-pal system protein YbgF